VFTDEVDLILVDWDLGNNIRGQDVIVEIRSSILYKDVVFYSAQTAPEALRRAVFEKGLEGIYCASREELVEEVLGVFESLVKKVLDLDHVRGIVMGATSDIDHMVNECLVAVHERLDRESQGSMLGDVRRRIQERLEDLTKTVKKLDNATLAELLKANMIFTANDRLRMLSRLLKGLGLLEYGEHIAEYQQKVIPDRNILGHVVLVPEGKPQFVTDGRGDRMSIGETRELRRRILDLRQQFRSLLMALQVPPIVDK
jgi:hypothetical protein